MKRKICFILDANYVGGRVGRGDSCPKANSYPTDIRGQEISQMEGGDYMQK